MIDDEEDYFRHEVPMADVHHEQVGETNVQVDYYQADDDQESIREFPLEELL